MTFQNWNHKPITKGAFAREIISVKTFWCVTRILLAVMFLTVYDSSFFKSTEGFCSVVAFTLLHHA